MTVCDKCHGNSMHVCGGCGQKHCSSSSCKGGYPKYKGTRCSSCGASKMTACDKCHGNSMHVCGGCGQKHCSSSSCKGGYPKYNGTRCSSCGASKVK